MNSQNEYLNDLKEAGACDDLKDSWKKESEEENKRRSLTACVIIGGV